MRTMFRASVYLFLQSQLMGKEQGIVFVLPNEANVDIHPQLTPRPVRSVDGELKSPAKGEAGAVSQGQA